jgi:outer membrane protein TolC
MKGPITLALIFTIGLVHAQDPTESDAYSLDECIAFAIENSVESRNARIDKEIANARVKETVGIGLPQVTGSVSAQQSPTQPRFFSQYIAPQPGQQGGGFSFISPTEAQAIGLEDGDVFAAQNFFQLKGSGDANLSINQLIFNGSYFVGLQAANAYKDLSVKEEGQTNESVIMNVSKAFYSVLINREQLVLINANLARIDTLLRNTQAMYENGFAEKLDVDRLKVNRNNLKVNKSSVENAAVISLMLLKFQMNFPYDQTLTIEGDLDQLAAQPIEVPSPEEWDYGLRPDYQVLKANQTLQELNIKNKYAEAIPVISAFANLGYSTQSPNFGGLFVTNSDFDEVGGIGPDTWYSYSTVGLRLSWNLFTGLQRTFQIQQEKLALLQIENGFESMEKSIDMEIEQSRRNLNTSLDRLEVQEENMELAEDIFETTQVKFQEGVGSNLEVVEADNALEEAQTNYYSALYDALIAQLELKKALGILHN